MMKKILTCLLCAALCLSMAACQSNSETPAQEETAKVEQKEEAQEAPEATEQAEESSSSETSTQYPLTISTYNYAKEPVEYTFEKAPERVITFWRQCLLWDWAIALFALWVWMKNLFCRNYSLNWKK